jgi:pimeloyl-ACP methyl ester carboxylesterase
VRSRACCPTGLARPRARLRRGRRRHQTRSARRWQRARQRLSVGLLGLIEAIGMPVFVANGESDPTILPGYSYLLAGLLPGPRLKIHPDAAHGLLFQHHKGLAADLSEFLES